MIFFQGNRRVPVYAVMALSFVVHATAQAGPAVPVPVPAPDVAPAAQVSSSPVAALVTPVAPVIPPSSSAPANAAVNAALTAGTQPPPPAATGAAPAAAALKPASNPTTTTTAAYDPSPPLVFQPGGTYNIPLTPSSGGGLLQIQGLQGETVPWSIVVLLTALTLIPSVLLCVTPFARLLIVFHFLRQALGLQTTPSNQTLIGLSLILTFFLMQPVGAQIYETAIVPMQGGQITAMEALGRSEAPMRKFMSHYVREKDVALFIDLAKEPRPATIDDVSLRVLVPAYILSELKAGFQIGTVLFLPFLIVDMVVASITTSVGMLQLPPVVISTPLKLLLFLMVDGWHLLIGSLMRSFS